MKLKILFCLLGLILVSCTKQFDNEYDTTNSSYWSNSYVYGIAIPKILNPPPTPPSSITTSNGTTQLVFYLGIASTDLSLKVDTTATSYKANIALPTGISLNSVSGAFSGTPTALLSSTPYSFTACNKSGCVTGNVSIRVINIIGTRVYGQAGDFAVSTSNNGGISANSLSAPSSVIIDPNGGVYISDLGNNRVLYYANGSTTATRVYGQSGSYTTSNTGTTTSTFGFSGVTALALDSSGALYVADGQNKRVLYFPTGVTTASQVYAQGGSFTTALSGTTANTINYVSSIAIDSTGGLYIADGITGGGNNRVLYFPAGSYNTATRVYGQGGSFTTSVVNKNGVSADSLYAPNGVSLDPSGGLYISDSGNSRVLYFSNPSSTTATQVYGSTEFTGLTGLGSTVTSLNGVLGVFGDSSGVYISLLGQSIYIPQNQKKHILAYGTGGVLNSFPSSSTVSSSSISTNSSSLITTFIGPDGKVYISDSGFNRVLMY
jgi:sugar lactone lactonase YvrE